MTVASSSSFSTTVLPRTGLISEALRQRIADYCELCRPRIALMTAVAVIVGYTLASPILFRVSTLIVAVPGVLLLVGASSIFNQCLERATDFRMKRTADRPIASGRIGIAEAVFAASLMTGVGVSVLWVHVNPTTAVATLATLVTYAFAYTPLKRISSLCTTVGAVPGAMPPVLGWLAAGGEPGLEALALFAVFFVWQFPHFLAIGWIHRNDYATAGLRMLPSFTDGGLRAGLVAVIYAIAFVPVATLPNLVGMSGDLYLAAAVVLSVIYLIYSVRFLAERSERRARGLLLNSLFCLPLLLIALVADFLRLTAMP